MIWYVDTTLYSNLDLSKESKIDGRIWKNNDLFRAKNVCALAWYISG